MVAGVFLGFDFGYKRIGIATGQEVTATARPLTTIEAKQGVPNWDLLMSIIQEWSPQALVVGLPTCINDKELYTTAAARKFAKELEKRTALTVYLVDERLTTKEARAQLFAEGGYKKIKNTQVDSIAASLILEQWLASKSKP
jgi:putative Holliday junction resolvase